METGSAQCFEPLVLLPGEVDVGKGAATKGSTGTATGRVVQRLVQQQAMSLLFYAPWK